jgi:diguanylate cyclase (GGDEF)-like protein
LIRAVGALLLVAAAVYFISPSIGSPQFLLDLLVFLGLGAFAIVAGYTARRHTINLEKKLRLTLIMRNMELENMSTRDSLTNLFNRRHFFDRLEREMQNARGFQRPLAVLLIDIDGMTNINKNHGYRVGDVVLASFGKFLLDQARASDLPARIGGDEFAVLLPDTTEQATAAAANRLQGALEKNTMYETDDVSIKLTATIASAGYPWTAETEDGIIQNAEASMKEQRRLAKAATSVS